MPSWKKVILSGSDAALNSLYATDHITVSGGLHLYDRFYDNVGSSGSHGQYLRMDSSSLVWTDRDFELESRYTASYFISESSLSIRHGLGTKNLTVSVYDDNDYYFIPASIRTRNYDVVDIEFAKITSGRVTVGVSGHIISGSIAQDISASRAHIENLYVGDLAVHTKTFTTSSNPEPGETQLVLLDNTVYTGFEILCSVTDGTNQRTSKIVGTMNGSALNYLEYNALPLGTPDMQIGAAVNSSGSAYVYSTGSAGYTVKYTLTQI